MMITQRTGRVRPVIITPTLPKARLRLYTIACRRRLPQLSQNSLEEREFTFSTLFFADSVLQFLGVAGILSSSLRVIGIDPGLNITGYGIIERQSIGTALVEAGIIRVPRSQGNNLPLRLESLFNGVQEVIAEFQPAALCLEEVYSHAEYPRTAILMGHARGVICLAARLAGIPVFHLSAKRVKQSVTGNGNASKLQVQRAVQHRFSLPRPPKPPDVADALAVALCYVNSLQAPVNGTRDNKSSLLKPKPSRKV
jgi:crossover junction endodeoxyribonuclease RuvC